MNIKVRKKRNWYLRNQSFDFWEYFMALLFGSKHSVHLDGHLLGNFLRHNRRDFNVVVGKHYSKLGVDGYSILCNNQLTSDNPFLLNSMNLKFSFAPDVVSAWLTKIYIFNYFPLKVSVWVFIRLDVVLVEVSFLETTIESFEGFHGDYKRKGSIGDTKEPGYCASLCLYQLQGRIGDKLYLSLRNLKYILSLCIQEYN